MGRFGWLVSLAILVVLGGVDRAQASPLKLAFSGGAFGVGIRTDPSNTIDVTNGFPRFGQNGQNLRVDESGIRSYNWQKPISGAIQATAVLSDADRVLATVQFSSPVTGTMYGFAGYSDISGTVHGTAVGVVTVAPGVDPSLIPSWLTGMTAKLDSFVSGGPAQGNFAGWYSSLTFTVADPAPVPEPSSVLVFLAAAGLVGVRRLRRA